MTREKLKRKGKVEKRQGKDERHEMVTKGDKSERVKDESVKGESVRWLKNLKTVHEHIM